MNNTRAGHRLRIGESRKLVLDVLHYSRGFPSFPAEKVFDLGALGQLRDNTRVRISWPALFVKAYALVAMELPELRRWYRPWPFPHFYQHPSSVATIAISRQHQGEDRLFWLQLRQPESRSLLELQQQLWRHQREPIEDLFARQLLLSRMPTWLRRILWSYRIHFSPHHRARRLGTFGLSVLAGQGVFNRYHPHFLTTSLSYGPLQRSGTTLVTLLCDHRVLDGMTAARALNRLEATLQGSIMAELAELADRATIPEADAA